jgi:hypothetical protein
MRAIAGGAAAAVAMAVTYGIVNATSHSEPLEKVAGAQPTGAAAMAKLRSHLAPSLRSAKECVDASSQPKALATIVCTWTSSHVPRTATYSLFADNAAMAESAEALRGRVPGRGGGGGLQGTSCSTADDFTNGGQTTWQSDNRERGTMWCYLNNGEPEIIATDTATTILTSATAPAQQAEQLLGWFRAEGKPEIAPAPVVPPTGGPGPNKPSPTRSPSRKPSVSPSVPAKPSTPPPVTTTPPVQTTPPRVPTTPPPPLPPTGPGPETQPVPQVPEPGTT